MHNQIAGTDDIGALIDQLHSMGCTVKGRTTTCPHHEDATPSASILSDSGHCRVYCHRCAQAWDLIDLRAMASGQSVAEIITASKKSTQAAPGMQVKRTAGATADTKPLFLPDKAAVVAYCTRIGTPARYYVYGPKNDPALIVARIHTAGGKKTFRQFTPTPEGYAAKNLREEGTLPLYRQDEIDRSRPILVVEGEKACDAAWGMGVQAVTSAMGAGKWGWSNWQSVAGCHVVLWPDHDDVGEKHMVGLAEHLGQLGCRVQKITPADDMPEGGDIADLAERWIDIPKEQQREMIETLMVDAEACGASAALDLWHRAVYDGSWRNLDWPLESCGRLSRATMPGCLTVLCASPGAGKSWMILQLMAHWNLSGTRTVVRMLEDDAQAHMARLLAHLSRNGLHTDDKWVRHNREQVEAEKAACRADLDHLGALIVPEQRELWEHSDMVAWVERHAKAGARVIVIDPITAVKAGREPWLQDFESVMHIKDIAYRYECSIIVTTHPRTTSREPAMTNLAGGSAWSRFAHTVLWIEHHEEGDELTATDGEPICCNRVLHILKTRHGKGAGCKIALQWLDSCSFAEVGLVGSGKPSAAAPKKPQSPRRPVAPVTTESRAALGEQAADMLFGDA